MSHNQRLLVEGKLDPRMAAMLEGGGVTVECVSILCQDVAELLGPRASKVVTESLYFDAEGLWVRKQSYVKRIFARLTEDGHLTSAADVRRVLSRWCTHYETHRLVGHSNHAYSGPMKATFWKMRLEEVINLARQESIECEAILQAAQRRVAEVPS